METTQLHRQRRCLVLGGLERGLGLIEVLVLEHHVGREVAQGHDEDGTHGEGGQMPMPMATPVRRSPPGGGRHRHRRRILCEGVGHRQGRGRSGPHRGVRSDPHRCALATAPLSSVGSQCAKTPRAGAVPRRPRWAPCNGRSGRSWVPTGPDTLRPWPWARTSTPSPSSTPTAWPTWVRCGPWPGSGRGRRAPTSTRWPRARSPTCTSSTTSSNRLIPRRTARSGSTGCATTSTSSSPVRWRRSTTRSATGCGSRPPVRCCRRSPSPGARWPSWRARPTRTPPGSSYGACGDRPSSGSARCRSSSAISPPSRSA